MCRSVDLRLAALRTEALGGARSSEESADPGGRALGIESPTALGRARFEPRPLLGRQRAEEDPAVRRGFQAQAVAELAECRASFRARAVTISGASPFARGAHDRAGLLAQALGRRREGLGVLAGQRTLAFGELEAAHELPRICLPRLCAALETGGSAVSAPNFVPVRCPGMPTVGVGEACDERDPGDPEEHGNRMGLHVRVPFLGRDLEPAGPLEVPLALCRSTRASGLRPARRMFARMSARHEVLLAVVGDVHANWRFLERVLARAVEARVDGILLVGDLGSHDLAHVARRNPERDARYLASIDQLVLRVERCGVPFAFVPGNHDLPDLAHDRNADGRVLDVAGLRVAGVGGAGPQRFGFAYEWNEDEIRARVVPECDVLLVHTPPARTPLDLLASRDEHVGSEAIRERALAHDGVLVCGHIHESPGAVELGRCLCLNAGGLGAPYGRAQIGFVRRSDALVGGWEVIHEDLASGVVRSFVRTDRQRSP